MKNERQTFSDGSIYFGDPRNKIIGPTPEDTEYFNSLFSGKRLEEVENDLIGQGLLVVNAESRLGEFLSSVLGKLPNRRLILPVAAVLSVLSIAAECPSDNEDESPTPIVIVKEKSPTESKEAELPLRFLDLPFPKDPQMQIQQGWTSRFEPNHNAIDYIEGKLDNSTTWKSFSVLAAADGLACANPPLRQGNAVFVEHRVVDGKIYYTYYGHLKEINASIPECSSGKKQHVKRGENIGTAGSTGVKDANDTDQPGWIHLHFGVLEGADKAVDPYDKYSSTIEDYPDPNFTNGKVCGSKTIFIDCPTEIKASQSPPPPKTPTPPNPQPRPVPTIKPTDKPTPFPQATEPIYTVVPKPTQTPEQTEAGWPIFVSTRYNYQLRYPPGWSLGSAQFQIGRNEVVELFYGDYQGVSDLDLDIVAIDENSFASLNDYINYLIQSEGAIIITSSPNPQDPNEPGLNELANLKLDGNSFTLLYSEVPDFGYSQRYIQNRVLLEKDGKLWQIRLVYPTDLSQEELKSPHEVFSKMLKSFHF